ncbi:hypothetical protein [Streptomyces sp. NBC_00299]|uniref:hypothetical protein n=1 Tax=Streptomyces sp. NBC_00299 TaxID=2975705 RepID=UPI002E2B4764|nr:hypothetical protein [Streptomyces sp. NBC_00299]
MATYALAGPSEDPGATGRAKRPVKVYDLALKGTGSQERELPRTSTKQFSLLGVSWTGPRKQIDGTAQVRTRNLETGEWSAWQDLELGVDPPEGVEPGMRGASEPLWVGPSDGVEVQVVREDGTASAGLPTGLEVNLVDPGMTSAETKSIGTEFEPAAFAAETDPAATPTDTVTPTDAVTPTDTATESPTADRPRRRRTASRPPTPRPRRTRPPRPRRRVRPCRQPRRPLSPSRRSPAGLSGARTSPRSTTRRRTTTRCRPCSHHTVGSNS